MHEHYQCWCKKEKENKENVVKTETANMEAAKATAEASFAEEKEKRGVRNKAYDDMNGKKKSLQEVPKIKTIGRSMEESGANRGWDYSDNASGN